MHLETDGCQTIVSFLDPVLLNNLRDTVFRDHAAGTRCLLDHPLVRETAVLMRETLVRGDFLPPSAAAIQAIAFDKTPGTNWKVAWHQDLMFPVSENTASSASGPVTRKDGVSYIMPSVEILEGLTAARLHLDDCGETNGPLRVSPGTHLLGIIPSSDVVETHERHGERACLAREGEILLMKPLALHASSAAANPARRRVLHFVFSSGETAPGYWHRAA